MMEIGMKNRLQSNPYFSVSSRRTPKDKGYVNDEVRPVIFQTGSQEIIKEILQAS
jgi:hypothetical protein